MIRYLIGGVVILFLVLLLLGALTGRVKAQSCCAVADPDRDLRMRTSDPSSPAADEAV
jgi:hypothetical protein